MKTYLLGWNPDEWPWENYNTIRRDCGPANPSPEKLRCSSTKPQIGDAFYIIRYVQADWTQ